jgi:methylaspartate ammonia-lyase
MSQIVETRRLGRRASEMLSLGRDSSEVAQNAPSFQTLQARHIAARFVVSDALARAIAELAFDKGRLR